MRTSGRIAAQRGLTIIELMVSVALSLIVLSALTYVYVSSRGAYRSNEAVARVQENGRFAMDWLSREIRSAGFYGCVSRGPAPVIVADDFTGFDMGLQAVAGNENGAGWTNPTSITRVPDTDVLLLSGMYGTAANILDDNPKAVNASTHVDKCIGLKQNDLVMATNCARSTIMRVTNNPENGSCPPPPAGNEVTDANNVNDPNFRLDPPYLKSSRAILFKFGAYAYFIGYNPANRPSLYRTSMDTVNPSTEEVVENIEGMDLLFGEDTDSDGSADVYRPASQVADWPRVVSVRVTLTAVSPDSGATNRPQSYYVGANRSGTVVDWEPPKNDLRLRQVFVSTVAVRNKLP